MTKGQVIQQFKKPFIFLKSDSNLLTFLPIVLFILLNTLKITLFNYYIIPTQTIETFSYKFGMTLLLAIILYPIVFRSKSFFPFILLYVAQFFYISANMSYYLFYHNYVHILQWITLFKEAFLSAGHSAAPINYKMLIILVDLPAFAYIIFRYSKMVKFTMKIRIPRIVLGTLALCILTLIEITNFNNGISFVNYSKDQSKGETPIVERYGTLINNAISLYLNGGEKGHEKKIVYGMPLENKIASNKNPNFIAIQVESMDAQVLSQKYKGHYIAPFLNSLASKNVYYPYVLSYHMGGGTSDSEFSITNSVQALEDYPAIKLTSYTYSNSFIKKLTAANYSALAFHGNVGSFYNRDIALPKMGFNKFYDIAAMGMKNYGWGAPDNIVFDYSLKKLKKLKQPFISYTITMTSHTPFTNASNYYNNELYNDIEDETVKNYFNSISYVDLSIYNYINQIQANFKNTYIFIWGDHTPNIDADLYHNASMTYDNKYFEFVPLIIITPDHQVYKENTRVASFLDISPTILRASGVKFNLKSDGINLLKFPLSMDNKIPYRSGNYDRKDLFTNITNSSLNPATP